MDLTNPNIMEGVLTPQDLFNLKVDTQARWDKITASPDNTNIPGPAIPPNFQGYDYSKNPLNPEHQTSIYDGLFSDNPMIKEQAQNSIAQDVMNTPAMKYNLGFKIDTPINEAQKYVGKEWGFDPTRDNEQFYLDRGYNQKGPIGKVLETVAKGVGRLAGGIVTKTGETFGQLGGMVMGGVGELQDAISGKDEHSFVQAIADNHMARWFEQAEETFKDRWLPVYKPSNWDNMGFWQKMGHGQYWSDDLSDGAAFMGAMIAENFILDGAGNALGLGKVGAATITGSGKMAKLARTALKFSTGAEDVGGVANWALSIAGESASESAGVFNDVKTDLKKKRDNGDLRYKDMSDDDINSIAGERAAGDFKANLGILTLSQAFENRFMFQPILKKLHGKFEGSAIEEPSEFSKGIKVSESTKNLDEFARAESNMQTYSGIADKYLNIRKQLKDPLSPLRFYGTKAVEATIMEGFWEENAQLAVQRLATNGNLNMKTFMDQMGKQTGDALHGNDHEAADSIGAGAVIGILGSAGTAAITRERSHLRAAATEAMGKYEMARKEYLSLQNAYLKDDKGNYIKDEVNGGYKMDPLKLEALKLGLKEHIKNQLDVDKLTDPVYRRYFQDHLLSNFVFAAKAAGIHDKVANRFDKLSRLTGDQVRDLGFDPSTTENIPAFQETFKEQSRIYDDVYESHKDVVKPNGVKDEEFQDTNNLRKAYLYSTLTSLKSRLRAADMYTSLTAQNAPDKLRTPTSIFQLHNSLLMQMALLDKFSQTMPKESTFYDDYVKNRRKDLYTKYVQTLGQIAERQKTGGVTSINVEDPETGKKIEQDVDIEKYKNFLNEDGTVKEGQEEAIQNQMGAESKDFVRHAGLQNAIADAQYTASKIADRKDGYKNFKEFQKHMDAIDEVDNKVDGAGKKNDPLVEGKDPNITDEERAKLKKERQGKPKTYQNVNTHTQGAQAKGLYKGKNDNRIQEDIHAYYGIKDGETGSLKEMTKKMIASPYVHPYLKAAFEKLLQHLPEDATVKFDSKQNYAPGFYEHNTHRITIDPSIAEKDNTSFEGVMLHEMIHLLTSDELQRDGYFTQQIQQLYDHAKKVLDSKKISTDFYGFKNLHEFLAEAYSNPELQKALQNVPSLTKQKSAWADFMAILSKFLKDTFGLDMKPSILDDTFNKVEEYLNDDLFNKATKALKEKGMTDEDLLPYSKREIIELAGREGLIKIPAKPRTKVDNPLQDKLNEIHEKMSQFIEDVAGVPDEVKDQMREAMKTDDFITKFIDLLKPHLGSLTSTADIQDLNSISNLVNEYKKLQNGGVLPTGPLSIKDQVKKWLDDGKIKGIYADQAKNDPEAFLKEIAQQGQNRGSDWSAVEGDASKAVRDQFGDEIVDYAIKQFPAPALPEGKYYEDVNNIPLLAKKIINGEKLSDDDLQLQNNFPKELEAELKRLKESDVTELTPESLDALEEAYKLMTEAQSRGMSYEDILREKGIYQNEHEIDTRVDEGKKNGVVVVLTKNPNEIKSKGKLTVAENAKLQPRFHFLQKLSDKGNYKDYKLVLRVKGNTIEARVADKDGNVMLFDKDGNHVKSNGSEIIFYPDLISYDNNSLNKPRIVASEKELEGVSLAEKNFTLHESFTKSGKPLHNVDQQILNHIKNSKTPITASIQMVTQGQLVRPGVTNKIGSEKSSTKAEDRTTLAEVLDKNRTHNQDNGTIVKEKGEFTQNNTYVRGGRLQVKMARDVNNPGAGYEIVEFRPNTIGQMVDENGKSLKDRLEPIFEKAIKGELSAEYETFLKNILDRRKFQILKLTDGRLLVVDAEKFMKTIPTLAEAKNSNLAADKILSLTKVSDILNSKMNLDQGLYNESEQDDLAQVRASYPDEVGDIIENYHQIVKNNVTTSTSQVSSGENKEGVARVNKRLVISLDQSFDDMKNNALKQDQEAEANDISIHNSDDESSINEAAKIMNSEKPYSEEEIKEASDLLSKFNCK